VFTKGKRLPVEADDVRRKGHDYMEQAMNIAAIKDEGCLVVVLDDASSVRMREGEVVPISLSSH
jgi:hypothetical protein